MNLASLVGDVLTSVPEPFATILIVVVPMVPAVLAHYLFDGRHRLRSIDREAVRVLRRRRRDSAERARQDVHTRAADRESAVLDRHVGGWRR